MRTGTATYATGQETARRILEVARRLFIEEGSGRLTMRRVAKEAGMSPGNLSYYYASKADLLADMLQYVIDGYISQFKALRAQSAAQPEQQFRAIVGYVYDDLSSRETTHFFPEIWVLANRDDWVAQKMEDMYAQYRAFLVDIMGLINPSLSPMQKNNLALMISASIEGHTVFIGHGRPHRARAAQLRTLLIEHFLRLVKEGHKPPMNPMENSQQEREQ